VLLQLKGETQEAVEQAQRVVALAPGHARANRLLGAVCLSTGQLDCARRALEAARAADPRDSPTYVFLGELALRSNDPAAVRYFAQALMLDQRSAAASRGYAAARARLGAQ
jgi:Flp pilus assembly protein TadD